MLVLGDSTFGDGLEEELDSLMGSLSDKVGRLTGQSSRPGHYRSIL